MRMVLLSILTISFLVSNYTYGQDATFNLERTWTYTYLKAKNGQKENLKKFIEQNWFVMDSVAVLRGLFNDYQLLEKITKEDAADWDFIVAVEYYTKGTYSDIQEQWLTIRNNHTKVLIDGYDFGDLGGIVKSEDIVKQTYEAPSNRCSEEYLELFKPFIGEWQEYLLENDEEKLYGNLAIEIDPTGCNIRKRFRSLINPFTYTTNTYYNPMEEVWMEIYNFSNGGYAIYKWLKEGQDIILERSESSWQADYLNRNRWTGITESSFQIVEERSYDGGKTWQVNSITNMKKVD